MPAKRLGLVLFALAVVWMLTLPVSVTAPDEPSLACPTLAYAGDPDQPAESNQDQGTHSGSCGEDEEEHVEQEEASVVQRVVQTVVAILSLIF